MDLIEQFFDYAMVPTQLLGNAVQPVNIGIGADADFMAIWLVANSTGAFTCTFSDGGTGRPFMNSAIQNANLFGTAQNPFPMLPPYVFKRQGQIQMTLTDTSGIPNTIQVVFSGKKIFPTPESGSAGVIER